MPYCKAIHQNPTGSPVGAVRLMPEKEEDGTVQKGVFFPGTGWSHREELMVILSSRLAKEDISILPVDWTAAIPFRPIETVDQAVDISLLASPSARSWGQNSRSILL